MKATIRYVNYHIPDHSISLEDYFNMLDETVLEKTNMKGIASKELARIFEKTLGIREIHIEDKKNEVSLFGQMLEHYFASGAAAPGEIDYIIYANWNSVVKGDPWSKTDAECINVPYFLQREFGMHNTQVFNIEQDCTGSLVGAQVASALINDGSARKILLLSKNILENQEYRLMGGVGIISDGLAMMELCAADSGLALIDFAAAADGSMTMDKDFSQGINQAKVVQVGANLIKSLLQKNNLTVKDISVIIPQNISKSVWNLYCQVLDFPMQKVFLENFTIGGHMGDVDIIRNIADVCKKGLVGAGDYAVSYGIGTGTSWNALLLHVG